MDRHSFMLKQYREQKHLERQEKILMSNRQEVDINGNGTSGYKVKSGVNEGKILAHKNTKSTTNW
jgi:hypothetical protein